VRLTVIPDADYELDAIHVYMLDLGGRIVTTAVIPISGSGNTFTFTMPAHHVAIVVIFRDTRTTGVDEIDGRPQGSPLQGYVQNGVLYITGLTPGKQWNVYNLSGVLICRDVAAADRAAVALPGRGLYLVTSDYHTVKVTN
jgi:hypothetical protein